MEHNSPGRERECQPTSRPDENVVLTGDGTKGSDHRSTLGKYQPQQPEKKPAAKATAVSLNADLFDRLEQHCKKTNLKRSTVMSLALEAYMGQYL